MSVLIVFYHEIFNKNKLPPDSKIRSDIKYAELQTRQ